MKKFLALLLILIFALSLSLVSCAKETPDDDDETEDNNEQDDGQVRVMSHADYLAAAVDEKVVVEAYVQAAQGWWAGNSGNGVITLYLQDNIGGYFAYEVACTEENAAKLTPGTKVRITGYKAEFNGEIEIINGTFEFLNNNDRYVAPVYDVTSLLGTDAVETHMNEYVSFKGLRVVAANDDGDAFLYKWDGSGKRGDDIYFKVTNGTDTFTFVIESYLTGSDTEIYKYIEQIKVGEKLDLEGYLYWYEGMQPHIVSAAAAKSEGVMSYAEYMAADVDDEVVIEAYVQAAQGWWAGNSGNGVITLYLQDIDGGYFAYDVACSEEDSAKLVPGTKVKITGYKAIFNGEVEVMNGTFEFGASNDTYIAEAYDATAILGTDAVEAHMNEYVSFKGLTVVAANDNGDAFMYKWDGSGKRGDDIYFKVTNGTDTFTFVIESYLTGSDTDVYAAVEALEVGDVIDMEGFLYWYEGMQPHIINVTAQADTGDASEEA